MQSAPPAFRTMDRVPAGCRGKNDVTSKTSRPATSQHDSADAWRLTSQGEDGAAPTHFARPQAPDRAARAVRVGARVVAVGTGVAGVHFHSVAVGLVEGQSALAAQRLVGRAVARRRRGRPGRRRRGRRRRPRWRRGGRGPAAAGGQGADGGARGA